MASIYMRFCAFAPKTPGNRVVSCQNEPEYSRRGTVISTALVLLLEGRSCEICRWTYFLLQCLKLR